MTSHMANDLKLSRYAVVTESFIDGPDGCRKRILFGSRMAEVCVIPEEDWRRLEEGLIGEVSVELVEELREKMLVVPAYQDELQAVLGENNAAIQENDVLHYVVQPTAACQLGCHYCGQKHTGRQLSEYDETRTVTRVGAKLESGKFRSLHVAWFGGEPLLAMAQIGSLTRQFKVLAESCFCSYSAEVVTNGLNLSHSVVTQLDQELSVEYVEVTLDGLQTDHDSRRHRKSGAGSFSQIFQNVVALAQRDDVQFSIGLRCNVDRQNYLSVVPLMDLLVEAGIHTRLENFYVAPIHSWGNDADHVSLSPEEFGRWQIEWYAAMLRRGFKVTLLPKRTKIVCMALETDAELVDAYGNLFNCTEVSYVPAYETPPPGEKLHTIGTPGAEAGDGTQNRNVYGIGTLAGGESPDKRMVLGDFNKRVARHELPCHACEMLPVCGGACPKLWLEGKVPCPPAKSNIKERLMLFHLLNMTRTAVEQL
jgi:uncharacterized protein